MDTTVDTTQTTVATTTIVGMTATGTETTITIGGGEFRGLTKSGLTNSSPAKASTWF